ncbi:MAG: ribonuclease PH [Parvularcula sp.]
MRPSGRAFDEMRDVQFEMGVNRYAEGSCLVSFGNTKVLCTASWDESVPPWMRNSGKGWVTAEYNMLPRSTHTRMRRERDRGPGGRTQEIQRLVGRSLRAIVDMKALGERQILLDCDVIQADGGTRTASITGAYVALQQAIGWGMTNGLLKASPLTDSVSAISCGLVNGMPVVDLDYDEDSTAQADANFVLTGAGGIVEVQGTAEGDPFSHDQFAALLTLATDACASLALKQKEAIDNG